MHKIILDETLDILFPTSYTAEEGLDRQQGDLHDSSPIFSRVFRVKTLNP